jgi:fibronectin type 3 domain-containing protein
LKTLFSFTTGLVVLCGWLLSAIPVFANLPGGGTGTGANVTLTDNGTTVTVANGIVSIIFTKSSAQISTINYTYNNGGGSQTINLVSGNPNGGKLYWENSNNEGLTFTYSLVVNPAANGGNYAEVAMVTTTVANIVMEVHYSLLRGSTGFYVTAIWSHQSADAAVSIGECRDNIYAGSIFNWMSVDPARSRVMEVSGGAVVPVLNAPVEVMLWTNGMYSGQYEDKYKYSADLGVQRVWGWSSVGTGGLNVGLWNISASAEYYNAGPMKRELMEHIGTTILNMLNGGHYGLGENDANWGAGELWNKVYGPYFIYCNSTNMPAGTNQPAQALYNDALAQGAAEQAAWPYYWFTNANYALASNRGTITGQIVIHDTGNPSASASNLWVGVVQQPVTVTNIYDFQQWMKPYQFWVKSGSNGNFTIPNVIAGTNYTLYAFGPGAAGTFQSQNQTGGNPPNTFNLPASPFSVTVTNGGATNNLGVITWTPTRVGATVFEIGYPNRTAEYKFRHGEDYWVSDFGPSATAPSPIWAKHLEYPFEFPNGPNYVVGQNRWTTDWNFVQPCIVDGSGFFDDSSATITFNLPSAPSGSASFYMALCSDYQGAMEISINGTQISPANGYDPNYSGSANECDTTIRQGIHADFSDNRINFSTSLLHSGQNTITIYMRQTGKVNGNGYFADHAMYDYIRLELTSYVPPAPANVAAYAGNNCNLICWPVTPGATSYNILRSTTSGSGYVSITNKVIGPVCGSGPNDAEYLDAGAGNGTNYYYVVQSVNPTGTSASSPQSSGATPSAGLSTTAPAPPAGLSVASSGHQSVTLNWAASAGANFYSVWRSTLVDTGGGSSNTLNTILLENTNTGTSYTDTSPTDGSIYGYFVIASSAGGDSSNSTPVTARPLPVPPTAAPGSLTATQSLIGTGATNILQWASVANAVGYVIQRSPTLGGTYIMLGSVTETNYTDAGVVSNATYYYKVTPVNAAGIAANALTTTRPAAPASLAAVAGNAQITLTWPAAIGATGYVVLRGTTSGNDTNIIVSGITSTNYINTGLTNGATYFYVVQSIGFSATSGNSPAANATPPILNLVWSGAASAAWNTSTLNWLNGVTPVTYANADTVTFNDTTQTNLSITGAVSPSLVTFANTNATYTVGGTGAGIAGATSLVKTSPGTVALASGNVYSGGTTISGGTLLVNNTSGSGTGSGAIAVGSSGTLGGTGIISGAVTVNSGGALAPGNPLGTLTISNNLTLAAGSATFVQVQDSPPTNGAVTVSGTLSAGGTLNVTNIGGALVNGDSFNLFNAANYSGAFAGFTLPPLTGNLVWNTNALAASGMLSVAAYLPPTIGQFTITGASLNFSGSGGIPGWTYYILAATNLPASWTPVMTNQFDAGGNFNFTNAYNPGSPQTFYKLQLQ